MRVADPPASRTSARTTALPARRSGRRIRTTFPGYAASSSRTAGARPLSETASRPQAPRTSTSSQSVPWVAVPASASPAASESSEHVELAVTPGSLSARRRPSVGSIPSSATNARYSANAFARSRPGRATARSRTFFGVCSSSTNSTTWTSYPTAPRSCARAASVTSAANRSRRVPCRSNGSKRRVLELRRSARAGSTGRRG